MQSSRVMINSGVLPSPWLDQLAASHPFIQQIDVVFPSSNQYERSFLSLETSYYWGKYTLSEFFDQASRTCHSTNTPLKAVPARCDPDDSWCIDPRGVLTLCVSKHLYGRLGLVGKRFPFKRCQELHGIKVLLKQETQSVAVRARQRRALNIWDDSRAESGHGEWEIAHVGGGLSTGTLHQTKIVKPQIWRYSDMFVPVIDIPQSKEESSEDREERIGGLLEWVGMACVGSQRLKANDRVDPYVAVYEPPMPSTVGNLTHLRWRGLMDSAFVQSVIAAATSLTTTGSTDDASFISVIMHSNPIAPVSYIPPSSIGSAMEETPPRVPRLDAEDTLCLVLANNTWMLGQSIGRWDARWG